MIRKFRWGNYIVGVYIIEVGEVVGINSTLKNNKHIIMWDFDDKPLTKIIYALEEVQAKFKLPKIHIMQMRSEADSYVAICFKQMKWEQALGIVCLTKYVDYQFIRHSCHRRYFTLRISPKGKDKPELAYIISSDAPEDADWNMLRSIANYRTEFDWQGERVWEGKKDILHLTK